VISARGRQSRERQQEHKQIADSAQIERLDSIPSRVARPKTAEPKARWHTKGGGSQVRDNKQITQPQQDGSALTLGGPAIKTKN
jgi:hypothetical protein